MVEFQPRKFTSLYKDASLQRISRSPLEYLDESTPLMSAIGMIGAESKICKNIVSVNIHKSKAQHKKMLFFKFKKDSHNGKQ